MRDHSSGPLETGGVKEPRGRRALIVTGEDSGDLHGANLIKACREIDPELGFFGIGGSRMAEAGCRIILSSAELAVVGAVEVVAHLPSILGAFQLLKMELQQQPRPDLLILIDFPEFNLRVAKMARKQGIPVLYYVSPQVWAWRRYRVKKIARLVDRLAVILPFEAEIYRPHGVRVEYVGNPLMDDFRRECSREEFLGRYGFDAASPLIGLFPGSRRNELKYMLDTVLAAAGLIARRRPEAQFVLPVAPSLKEENLAPAVRDCGLPIRMVRDNIYDVAGSCDAVICVSGTATLQVALAATPMVILYKLSPLTYWLGRLLVRVPFIGLANIVAGKGVVKELIQDQASPENIAAEILRFLNDTDYAEGVRKELMAVRNQMGEGGCSLKVARMASEMSFGVQKP
ncbi:MAG: lipid-A-disaccharide synthase [Deltaproteobacteria bacterium]|nr:lipid-A-disaccharide synthase [Deltaproteobacteria bacterium]